MVPCLFKLATLALILSAVIKLRVFQIHTNVMELLTAGMLQMKRIVIMVRFCHK